MLDVRAPDAELLEMWHYCWQSSDLPTDLEAWAVWLTWLVYCGEIGGSRDGAE